MMLLIEAIKAKSSKKDIKRLNKILKEQNGHLDKSYSKIQELQKKLVLQEIKNQASKNELSDTKKLLEKLQREKNKYDNKIIEQKSEIGKIKRLVQKAKNRIKKENKKACMMEIGMIKSEVKKSLGIPSTSDASSIAGNCIDTFGIDSSMCDEWYYGKIKLIFDSNILIKKDGLTYTSKGCR